MSEEDAQCPSRQIREWWIGFASRSDHEVSRRFSLVQEKSRRMFRSHFGSSHFLFESARCFFPFTSFSGFVLSKCLQFSFVVSHRFLWHVRAMEQMCEYLRHQPHLRITGFPNGSLPELEGTGYRPSTMEEKINEMSVQIALPLLMQSLSKFENCVQTLSQTVASYDAKITNIEQILQPVSPYRKRLQRQPPVVPARQALGIYLGMVMAPQPQGSHGPGSSDDNRNTRRRLDTFSNPEA